MTGAMAAPTHTVLHAAEADLDRVARCWLAMAAHHASIADAAWIRRTAEDSWRRRRASYAAWLASGEGRLLLAVPAGEPAAAADGYAFVRVRKGGETFDLGERVGELESLAVVAEARGVGVGGLLLDAARELLRREGIAHWFVSYIEGNDGADRLYRRAGFRPFARTLMGPVEP